FSKMLFGGSQSKLNETIRDLTSFATLDEEREYIGDAYYENNWENSDEYEQRLWQVVESKFLSRRIKHDGRNFWFPECLFYRSSRCRDERCGAVPSRYRNPRLPQRPLL